MSWVWEGWRCSGSGRMCRCVTGVQCAAVVASTFRMLFAFGRSAWLSSCEPRYHVRKIRMRERRGSRVCWFRTVRLVGIHHFRLRGGPGSSCFRERERVRRVPCCRRVVRWKRYPVQDRSVFTGRASNGATKDRSVCASLSDIRAGCWAAEWSCSVRS